VGGITGKSLHVSFCSLTTKQRLGKSQNYLLLIFLNVSENTLSTGNLPDNLKKCDTNSAFALISISHENYK
jgi:hypothetical protein